MPINLEMWEINMILNILGQRPYNEVAATIRGIVDQVDPPDKVEVTRCERCAWFAPIESIPEAEKLHRLLQDTFGDCLPKREGCIGICRKKTFCKEWPVLKNSNGYCDSAERRDDA